MTADAPIARLLVVDDEVLSMEALRDTLQVRGYETVGCTSGAEAMRALGESAFDLLLTDLMMPGMDGVQLLTAAIGIDPHLGGVLMTGLGSIDTAVQAMKAGAVDYVQKPIKMAALIPVLSRALGIRRLRQENVALRDTVAIHELNQALAHTVDRSVLIEKIADAAMEQVDADEASILLVSDDGSAFVVAAVRGDRRADLVGECVPLVGGVAGWVASHREPLILTGAITDLRWSPRHPRADIRSALSLPMIARNRLVGVVNVAYTTPRPAFTAGHAKVLTILANAAAAAIEATRLHDEERKADARYREVLDMAVDGIVSIDGEHRIVVFNAAASRLFGYSNDEALGKPAHDLFPFEDAASLWNPEGAAADDAGATRQAAEHARVLGRQKDGTLFNAEVGISGPSENDRALSTAIVRDVTERIHQEDRIARLTRLYAVRSGINQAIVRIVDEDALYGEICRVAEDDGRFEIAFVAKMDPASNEVSVVDQADHRLPGLPIHFTPMKPVLRATLNRTITERRLVWDNDFHFGVDETGRSAGDVCAVAGLPFEVDGVIRSVMLLYSATPGAFGEDEVDLVRAIGGDVSFALDHLAKGRQLDYLATHDALTGLPNRALFVDRLSQAMSIARPKRDLIAVVLADIEHFKHINYACGRQAGDTLLNQVAERLREHVGQDRSIARVGGDVFAMIFSARDDAADIAKNMTKEIAQAMNVPFDVNGRSVNLALRTGSAIFPTDGVDAERLFHNAESALKRAKTLHEPFGFYTADLNARVAQQLTLESKLRGALERNEFVLHYQPKVDFRTGTVVGLEALLRWADPETGLVPPIEFISLLEETGLILDVGRWVMTEAVKTAAILRASGLDDVRIAVNVSPIQLRQEDFVGVVANAVAPAGDRSHGLDIEITESVVMSDIESNIRKLDEIRAMGVEVAIDDFGTGYSSLSYMARLPVRIVKIDRSFIQHMVGDSNSLAVVSTIISLAHSLDLMVVAEGVETADQITALDGLSCDQFQGYFFSKPLPLPAVIALMRAPPAIRGTTATRVPPLRLVLQ